MSINFDFSEFMDALAGDLFDEKPVSIEQFVTDEHYLGLPPLSENQYTIIKAMTQIYKKETLVQLYGEDEGEVEKGHLVPLARVGQELRAMGIDTEE